MKINQRVIGNKLIKKTPNMCFSWERVWGKLKVRSVNVTDKDS